MILELITSERRARPPHRGEQDGVVEEDMKSYLRNPWIETLNLTPEPLRPNLIRWAQLIVDGNAQATALLNTGMSLERLLKSKALRRVLMRTYSP